MKIEYKLKQERFEMINFEKSFIIIKIEREIEKMYFN